VNYFPFHVGDYAAHTGHLEPMEDLAYRRLLDQYYLREGPLPADIQATAKLVRMRSMLADVECVLNEFFVLTDAGWMHVRCETEVAKMQDKQTKAREAAELSVKSRRAAVERRLAIEQADAERALEIKQADVQLPTPTPTPTPTPVLKREKTAPIGFPLPDWVNVQHWDAWHSNAKRKKATNAQKQVAIDKLDGWRLSGDDYAGALENAAAGGYQGLFLPDKKNNSISSAKQPKSFAQQDREAGMARWEEQTGRIHPDRMQQTQTIKIIPILEIEQ
jgi:uncharacterized protein YdaU (DUF1376 family)